jgi:UDP-glucose 4-epimerase
MDNHNFAGDLQDAQVVAVTGGCGFVGRHLVRRLRALDKRVVVLDLADPPYLPTDDHVRYCRVDLLDYDAVVRALTGVDVVFHLAGNASGTLSVEQPRLDFQINALGTCNVGNAVDEVGARRLVYLSSAIVYGPPRATPMPEDHPTTPFLPYGASKLSGELTLRSLHDAIGLPVVVGRAFVVYGPGEDPRRAGGEVSQFLRWQLNGLPIPVAGDLDLKTRDFLHVDDLATGLLILADRGSLGETYNLGSGTEVSMRELGRVVSEATGRDAVLDADDLVLEDSFRLVADIGRLRALGFRPAVPLVDGIRSLVSELGEQPELPSTRAVFRRTPVAAKVAGLEAAC